MRARLLGRLGIITAAAALVIPLLVSPSPVFAQANILKLGAPSLPPSRGNPLQGLGTPTSYVWSAIFDAMTRIDEAGNVAPEAAVRWKNMSPTTWQIELRPNVKFHNGEPLDAAGVAQNIMYLLNDDIGRASLTGKDLSQKIANARAIDKLTLEIETTFPNPEIPREVMKLYLVAPKAWQDMGVEGFSANPSGTGSYKVEDWGPEVVKLIAADSWRKPNVERLQVPEPVRGGGASSGAIVGSDRHRRRSFDRFDRPTRRRGLQSRYLFGALYHGLALRQRHSNQS